MTAQILHSTRELHSRSNDGIDVRLLWNDHDGRVTVAVADHKTGDAFVVEVLAGERAMDVFHHPYAYASFHDVAIATPSTHESVSRLAA
jgi:pterin-4a-carbinolamine dehydratase